MSNPCASKPLTNTRTRLDELISWRLIKKNPSGGLIWGIFGASLIVNSYFWVHFLRFKEYQVTISNMEFVHYCQTLINFYKIGRPQKTHVE